jgi:hypothetical protein
MTGFSVSLQNGWSAAKNIFFGYTGICSKEREKQAEVQMPEWASPSRSDSRIARWFFEPESVELRQVRNTMNSTTNGPNPATQPFIPGTPLPGISWNQQRDNLANHTGNGYNTATEAIGQRMQHDYIDQMSPDIVQNHEVLSGYTFYDAATKLRDMGIAPNEQIAYRSLAAQNPSVKLYDATGKVIDPLSKADLNRNVTKTNLQADSTINFSTRPEDYNYTEFLKQMH